MDIMTVSPAKQHLFIQRVLFMYDITKQSAGKAQVLRISLDRWIAECDIACLCGFILEEMERFRDPKNLTVFSKETLGVLMSRFIEGPLNMKV